MRGQATRGLASFYLRKKIKNGKGVDMLDPKTFNAFDVICWSEKTLSKRIGDWIKRRLTCGICGALFATSVGAQQPLPDPTLLLLRNAIPDAVARQADGKLLVAGGGVANYQFLGSAGNPVFSGVFKEGLLRVNVDGSLDTTFTVDIDPYNAAGSVGSVFDVQIFGNFAYVLGDFQSIGGLARNGLARINLTTNSVDQAWNPNPVRRGNNQVAVASIALDGSGNLYTFGSLYDIGGKSNVRMAKIPATSVSGAADANFDGRQVVVNLADDIPAGFVFAAPVPNGPVYVVGRKVNLGPSRNSRIYRINPVTGVQDSSWTPDLTAIDMFINRAIADAAGDIYVAGQATGTATIGSNLTSPYNLVKLNGTTGQVASGWVGVINPPGVFVGTPATYEIRAHYGLALDGSGSLYALAGRFFSDSSQTVLTKYNANTGVADSAFAGRTLAGGNATATFVNVASEGVFVGGPGYYGPTRTGSILKVDRATGAPLPGFNVNLKGQGLVSSSTRLADGRVVMGGAFQEANGVALNNLIRFNPDGTFDPTFNSGPNGLVIGIRDILGKLYVGGGFGFSGSSVRQFIARYDSITGALDANWAPTIDGTARAFAGDADNIYIVGGAYTVNGVITNCLAKVSAANAQVDVNWRPQLAQVAFGTLCQRAIAKVGNFVYVGFPNTANFVGSPRLLVNGQLRTLARIDATTGQIDSSWDPNPNGSISAMTDDGTNIYVSGGFTTISGVNTRLAKINGASGAIDPTFLQPFTGMPGTPTWIRSAPSAVFVIGTESPTTFTNQVRPFVWKIRPDGSRDTAWAPSFGSNDSQNSFNSAVEPLGASRVMVGAAFGPGGDVLQTTVGGNPAFRLPGPGGLSIAAFSVVAPTTLTLEINGRGTVDVSSNGGTPNVQCFDCKGGPFSYEFDTAATVTLTARALPGWIFVGWKGDKGAASCITNGPCVLTLNASTNVSASFRNVANLIEQ